MRQSGFELPRHSQVAEARNVHDGVRDAREGAGEAREHDGLHGDEMKHVRLLGSQDARELPDRSGLAYGVHGGAVVVELDGAYVKRLDFGQAPGSARDDDDLAGELAQLGDQRTEMGEEKPVLSDGDENFGKGGLVIGQSDALSGRSAR